MVCPGMEGCYFLRKIWSPSCRVNEVIVQKDSNSYDPARPNAIANPPKSKSRWQRDNTLHMRS